MWTRLSYLVGTGLFAVTWLAIFVLRERNQIAGGSVLIWASIFFWFSWKRLGRSPWRGVLVAVLIWFAAALSGGIVGMLGKQ